MNPREKRLVIIIGVLVGVGALYKCVNWVYLDPLENAKTDLANLQKADRDNQMTMSLEGRLRNDWKALVGRTLSYSRQEASDLLDASLKELATKHGFNDAVFSKTTGTRIGRSKWKLATVGDRVTMEGDYDKVLAFLHDVYAQPYLSQVTELTLSRPRRQDARNSVKMDFTIETPVLPEPQDHDTLKEMKALVGARKTIVPMARDPESGLGPAREYLNESDAFALLGERNIFRPYMPPPDNILVLDNQDWKTVALRVQWFWEGKQQSQEPVTIASRSEKTVRGKGDVVEVSGAYADGKPFGPKRYDFTTGSNWKHTIAMHHPAPPPETITLAVNNQHDAPVYLEVLVTMEDGTQQTKPEMRFEPGTHDVDQYRDVQSIRVTGKYESGAAHRAQIYQPSETKATYVIPQEPKEVQVVEDEPSPSDPVPDAQYTVTGLLTYSGAHEMIATGMGSERVVHSAGEPGAIDGGMLLVVHPLGGVVQMPSGNFYLYPLGRNFMDRVLLEARSVEELPAAIDAWTRRPLSGGLTSSNRAAMAE